MMLPINMNRMANFGSIGSPLPIPAQRAALRYRPGGVAPMPLRYAALQKALYS
jgi:hypothetical protein